MKMLVDESEEVNQKLKYSNERTSESWRKAEATAMGSSAVTIVHVLSGCLASSYPIRRAFFRHISSEEFPSNLS